MKTKQVFYFKHTDLFAGECNYCFLNQFAVMANTERGAVNVLSRHIGLNHRFDGCKYVSKSGCTAFYLIDWELTDKQQEKYAPVNFDRGNTDFPAAPEQKCYVL